MIANPIGYPTGDPTTHPNRGRIARPGPSRPGPYRPQLSLSPHLILLVERLQIQSLRYVTRGFASDWI